MPALKDTMKNPTKKPSQGAAAKNGRRHFTKHNAASSSSKPKPKPSPDVALAALDYDHLTAASQHPVFHDLLAPRLHAALKALTKLAKKSTDFESQRLTRKLKSTPPATDDARKLDAKIMALKLFASASVAPLWLASALAKHKQLRVLVSLLPAHPPAQTSGVDEQTASLVKGCKVYTGGIKADVLDPLAKAVVEAVRKVPAADADVDADSSAGSAAEAEHVDVDSDSDDGEDGEPSDVEWSSGEVDEDSGAIRSTVREDASDTSSDSGDDDGVVRAIPDEDELRHILMQAGAGSVEEERPVGESDEDEEQEEDVEWSSGELEQARGSDPESASESDDSGSDDGVVRSIPDEEELRAILAGGFASDAVSESDDNQDDQEDAEWSSGELDGTGDSDAPDSDSGSDDDDDDGVLRSIPDPDELAAILAAQSAASTGGEHDTSGSDGDTEHDEDEDAMDVDSDPVPSRKRKAASDEALARTDKPPAKKQRTDGSAAKGGKPVAGGKQPQKKKKNRPGQAQRKQKFLESQRAAGLLPPDQDPLVKRQKAREAAAAASASARGGRGGSRGGAAGRGGFAPSRGAPAAAGGGRGGGGFGAFSSRGAPPTGRGGGFGAPRGGAPSDRPRFTRPAPPRPPTKKDNEGPLHPSWEAKRLEKERIEAVKKAGKPKLVVFDD